jgi:hypothetical protein
MRALPITPLLLGLLVAGCPSSSPGDGNPKALWLATDLGETHVKLIPSEPDPF